MQPVPIPALALLAPGLADGVRPGRHTCQLTIREGHFKPATLEVLTMQRFKMRHARLEARPA